MPVANISTDTRVPVTVLTGFLGAGKTTLLNRILTQQHGRRIAVIENEFGEVGVDQEFVIGVQEEIFEMNNGCICCTVRGDLIRILGNLMKRRDRFDYILIETTGLADPGPVAQTFFVDDDMQAKLRLDGIVTVVDAKHLAQHIDDPTGEVREQIAFADVLLLNKTDLVSADEAAAIEKRLRAMNANAKIIATRQAEVPVDTVLNVRGFSLERALEIEPEFLEPEYPFEWGGVYDLQAGPHQWTCQAGRDATMTIAVVTGPTADAAGLQAATLPAVLAFSDKTVRVVGVGETLTVGGGRQTLQLPQTGSASYGLEVPTAGPLAIFCEHRPQEFAAQLIGPRGQLLVAAHQKVYQPDHQHNRDVTSVGISTTGDVDGERLNEWMRELLATKGPDLYRYKGVIAVAGEAKRFVFQGVHMMLDSQPDRPWGDQPRQNKMIFVGRNLDRAALREGFAKCLVAAKPAN